MDWTANRDRVDTILRYVTDGERFGETLPRYRFNKRAGVSDLTEMTACARSKSVSLVFACAILGFQGGQAHADDWIISNAQAATAKSHPDPEFTFSIPPESLDEALAAFGTTTGIELLYSSQLTSEKLSVGVHGKLTADTALRAILEGTSLVPVQSTTSAVMLVRQAGMISDLGQPAPAGPVLKLDLLRVEAPRYPDYLPYAASLTSSIRAALQRSDAMRQRNYRGLLSIWVSPAGIVQDCDFARSTGDLALDGTITRVVKASGIQQSPPPDLPQPVYVWITMGETSVTGKPFIAPLATSARN